MSQIARVLGTLAALAALTGLSACGDDEPSASVRDDFMKRWNVMAQNPERTFDFLGRPADVVWEIWEDFPHPTYRGGSAAAYGTFALVLADLYDNGGNFDFLAKHELFRYRLRFGLTPSTADSTSLLEMTEYLSADDHFAAVPGATRTSLRKHLERIRKL